ncbi:MAG: S41 family peptidase [Patescibacteria group bacterium]
MDSIHPFSPHNQPKRTVPITLAIVLFIIGLGLGIFINTSVIKQAFSGTGSVLNLNSKPPEYLAKDIDFNLFWQVWDYVRKYSYERDVKDTKLFYGALQGLVAGLDDPYSIYLDPEMARQFDKELQGTFDGIGAEIGIRDKKLVVVAPLPGTPAERAKLKPGDKILGINEFDTTGMPVDQAVNLIRGPRGTKVKLTILSNGETEPREVELKRDKIVIQLVKGELKSLPNSKNKVAYIKISQFGRDTDSEFLAIWTKLSAQGAKSIILDLRNDPGGFLDQAVAISSHWIKDGSVVREQFTPPDFRDYESEGNGELAQVPTIVLVNEGSASASEIVTGALQDYKLATVVGEKTFGKGSVQNLEEFPDGSAVKLTIAKWFTPKGRSIDKNGLVPDIEVKRTREDIEADRDPQLERALELLER